MKKETIKGDIFFVGSGVILAATIYFIHYLLFSNFYQTISSVILSFAYVPIGVIYQTYIINKILEKRELMRVDKKINIVIGSFYHEVGIEVINKLILGDKNIEKVREYFFVNDKWEIADFERLEAIVEKYQCDLQVNDMVIGELAIFLDEKDDFILELLTNSALTGCDNFNEMLMSILHLRDELQSKYYNNINRCEAQHVTSDLCKAYKYLIVQWIDYIKHLKDYYPFLYTKALKNSPFDNRSIVEKEKQNIYVSRDV